MSRKRRKKRSQYNGEPLVKVKQSDYVKYQRFIRVLPHLEEALDDLETGWSGHVDFMIQELNFSASEFEDVSDSITRVRDVLSMIENSKKYENHVRTENQKFIGWSGKKKEKKEKKFTFSKVILEEIAIKNGSL